MKKIIAAAAAVILTAGLTACSGDSSGVSSAVLADSQTALTTQDIRITIPPDWEVYSGKQVYKYLYENSDEGFDSADDLQKSYEDSGTSRLIYAMNKDKTAVLSLTALEITTDETTGERLTVEEYARQNHDTGVFSYQASGMFIRNSSFGEETVAGKTGFMSHYEVCTDEDVSTLLMGQSEFIYENNGKFCSLQVYYQSEDAAAETDSILAGVSAE